MVNHRAETTVNYVTDNWLVSEKARALCGEIRAVLTTIQYYRAKFRYVIVHRWMYISLHNK